MALAQLRYGLLRKWTVGTYLANVQFVDSLAGLLTDVPVNRAIADGDMTLGRNVMVAFGDPGDPQTAVVISVST